MPSPASLSRPQRAGARFARRPAAPRVARSSHMVTCAIAGQPKKVLMMGGTRFIGQYLARMLVDQGHDVTLYTRGRSPITSRIPDDTDEEYATFSASVKHITGDRKDFADVRSKLTGSGFDVVYDINGRDAVEAEPILDALPNLQQYIYCSSAGVYLKSPEMPHRETDAVDPKSRHKGKLDTESLLQRRNVNYTSIRPVYIYGPLNYNPVEEFCFQRIAAGRPICVPGSGMQLTQMGHVKDLASAFVKVLGNDKAARQIYNISGERFVTFDGFARLCAEAMEAPEPELVHFNPKEFDFGKKKAFPMRDQHFFASIDKAVADLDWVPEFGLLEGLKDSYSKDFGRGTYRKEPDFTADDMVLSRLRGRVMV